MTSLLFINVEICVGHRTTKNKIEKCLKIALTRRICYGDRSFR